MSPKSLWIGIKGDPRVTELGCSCGWRFYPTDGDITIDDANARLDRHLVNDAPHVPSPHAIFVIFDDR